MAKWSIRRLSLQWLLPSAISLLLLVVLVVFSWWAYADMAGSLRDDAHKRLELVAGQVSQSLQSSVVRYNRNVQKRADSTGVRAFLNDPTPQNLAAAREAITYRGNRPETSAAIELLDAGGERVLASGPDSARLRGAARRLVTRTHSAETSAVGAFHALNDTTVLLPAIAMVSHQGKRVGYVVEWWVIRQTKAERDLFSRLLGSGGRMLLGSQNGVWTDQATVQPPPPDPVAAAKGEIATYEHAGLGKQFGILADVPGAPWQMLIEFPEADVLAPAHRFRNHLIWAAAILIVVSFAGAWLISRRVTKPLQQLTSVSEAISAGRYARRVRINGADELTRLGSAFNVMTEKIQAAHHDLEHKIEELRTTREQFVRAQRMEAVGQLAGGIAHDFNNLLTVILAESEFARDEHAPEARNKSIAEINRAGERAASLTRQLLAFSRRQLFAPTVFNVPELVHDMDRMLTRLVGDNIRLVTADTAREPNVRADKGQVEQVLVNLIVNARDAMPNGGTISIETRNMVLDENAAHLREDLAPGEYIVISVSDTGVGITEEVMAHIFEPFYTTKEHGRGTGLGLATSYGIVKQSGGYIAAYSEPGLGTTMRVFLPVVHEQATPVHRRVVERATGAETILLIEDENAVRNVAARMLKRQGYQVLEADSGEAGLEILKTYAGEIQLVLTDVVLPGMGGREIAERAMLLRPQVKVLFTSGYTDDVILQHNLIVEDAALVEKPFTAEGLARGVREVLDN
jgi:signal transduction histidine kinase